MLFVLLDCQPLSITSGKLLKEYLGCGVVCVPPSDNYRVAMYEAAEFSQNLV